MKEITKNLQIGIIGPEEKYLPKNRKNREKILKAAEIIGKIIAEGKAVLITGGCSGVVEAACKGAYENDGIVVSTPGRKRWSAIPYTTVEICTPIDIGDFVFAGTLSCDAIIVIPGDAGTLAEIAIAYRNKKPLIFIKGFGEKILNQLKLENRKNYPYFVVDSAEKAAELAIKLSAASLFGSNS